MAGRGRPILPASSDSFDEWSDQLDFDAPQQSGSTNWSDSPVPDVASFSGSATFSQSGTGFENPNREFSSQACLIGRQDSRGNRGGYGATGPVSQRGGRYDDGEDSSFGGYQRGGFGDSRGRGGYGGSQSSRVRRGFRSNQDQENSEFSRDKSNEDSVAKHRGGFGSSRGRGHRGFSNSRDNDEFGNRGYDVRTETDEIPRGGGSRGRGSFGGDRDRGGFGGDRDRGDLRGGRNHGGFGGDRGRGGFGGDKDRGDFGGGRNRGGFGGDRDRGGFGGDRERGSFGGFTGDSDRGGFGSGRNRGGIDGYQNRISGAGFSKNFENNNVDNRNDRRSEGFRRDRGGRDGFNDPRSRDDFDDSAVDRSRGGFGGSRGRGGFRRELDEASGEVSGRDWSRDYNDKPRDGFRGGRGGFRSRNVGDSGENICYKCTQPGHLACECPNADARACFTGGEAGQFATEFPNSKSANRDGPSAAHIPEKAELNEIYQRTVHAGINFDNYEKVDVEVSGSDKPGLLQSFNDIGLPPIMLENVYKKFNYRKLTPVQKYAIPIVLRRRDLMACAQTGSGKTAAFLLPLAKLVSEINDFNTVEEYTTFPIVLVLAPTRELCNQTYEFGLGFLANTGLKIQRIYGGPKTEYLRAELANGCHILVATPGRLKDFAERNIISLKKTRFLVLDEADQMLDRGFLDSVTWTLDQMPSERQILMFSATFAGQIQALARQYLQNYLYLTVGKVGAANPDVAQEIREVQQDNKQAELESVIDEWHSDPSRQKDRILIFVETKRQADFVGLALSQKKKLPCTTIHGDREQREREIALREFRRGKNPILVATNVSARGVDINGIELVINMDLPNDFEMYVHRIGRTGRCGNTGKSISFYDHGRDSALAQQLRQKLQDSGQPVPDWLDVYADQCGGGVGMGGGFGGTSRDMRRGVTRDRYREQPDEGDFADNAFRPAPAAAASPVEEESWD